MFAMTLVLLLLIAVAMVLAYWYWRPNRSRVDPRLVVETWPVAADGAHNSNTDLIRWDGFFYLVHAASPWHFASEKCRIVVKRSTDARRWETVAEFHNPGGDIRDPKFALIGDRLFLYVLLNQTLDPLPHATQVTCSADGVHWEPLQAVGPEGWLFWRPRTRDGATWYVPAYWRGQGKVDLLQSPDGLMWTPVSRIFEGEQCSETDIAFLPDGRLLALVRLEAGGNYWLGDEGAATAIAIADPPYTEWRTSRSLVTRMDGMVVFGHDGLMFAVGRHHPEPRRPFTWKGSILGRKRTALYRVGETELVHLSDMPSDGDTAYAGVAVHDGDAYISYYTSPIGRDWPWIMGMLARSDIQIARVPLAALDVASELQFPRAGQ